MPYASPNALALVKFHTCLSARACCRRAIAAFPQVELAATPWQMVQVRRRTGWLYGWPALERQQRAGSQRKMQEYYGLLQCYIARTTRLQLRVACGGPGVTSLYVMFVYARVALAGPTPVVRRQPRCRSGGAARRA